MSVDICVNLEILDLEDSDADVLRSLDRNTSVEFWKIMRAKCCMHMVAKTRGATTMNEDERVIVEQVMALLKKSTGTLREEFSQTLLPCV